MCVNATPNQKGSHGSNRVQATYVPLGVDETGAHHVWHTPTDTVHVVADGRRERVQVLDQPHPNKWIRYVRNERGWARRRYFEDVDAWATARFEGAV